MTIELKYDYKPKYKIGVYYLDKYYPQRLNHKDDFSEIILGIKNGNYTAIGAGADILKAAFTYSFEGYSEDYDEVSFEFEIKVE